MPSGTVSEFGDERGLGTIVGDDGREYLFHVVEIVDGSRSIEVGQAVVFEPLPKFGAVQAGSIQKV